MSDARLAGSGGAASAWCWPRRRGRQGRDRPGAAGAAEPDLALSVSATTRPPRPGERDGVDYCFLGRAGFDALAAAGGLLEWARCSATATARPRAPVEAALAAGPDMLFDIDWQGHRQLRAALPGDVVGVFLLPPSLAELEARLRERGADDAADDRPPHGRPRATRSRTGAEFDHVVLNHDLDAAVADVRSILRAARLRVARQTGLAEFVARL